MRQNILTQQHLEEVVKPFRDLIGPNEWLNFDELVQRIRLSESLSEPNAKAAILALAGSDGIVLEKDGKIKIRIIYGGYVLACAG